MREIINDLLNSTENRVYLPEFQGKQRLYKVVVRVDRENPDYGWVVCSSNREDYLEKLVEQAKFYNSEQEFKFF